MVAEPVLPPLHKTFVLPTNDRVGVVQATEAVPIVMSKSAQLPLNGIDGVKRISSILLKAGLAVKFTAVLFARLV